MTLLAEVAAASEEIAATSSRLAKRRVLVGLLGSLAPDEVEPVVAMLTGELRQGRIGVGWATLSATSPGTAARDASLTVGEFDGRVDDIAATTGEGSASARAAMLDDLLGRTTQAERRLVSRLFGEGLRQGALDGVMTDAVAHATGCPVDDVRRAAMLVGSLPAAARIALIDGPDALRSVGLRLLRAVQPMLASTSPDVTSAVTELGDCSVEWKLDGVRIQVHRDGTEVRVFTRNLNDVTARLPRIADVARSLPVRSVILDGEALMIGADERPVAFQDTMSRFGTRAERAGNDAGIGTDDEVEVSRVGAEDRLAPFFFDVVHLDGIDLLDEPLRSRLVELDRIAGTHRIPAVSTSDPEAAAAVLAEATRLGHEGVMVKSLDSRYEAGRRGSSWRKVKPVKTLDLVVLAAEWGHGRRQGWLSNLHLGARDHDGRFVMVGKTFKGLTDATLAWQTAELLVRETRRTGITVWVRPELVVEIALDGVQRSTRYPGGVALRFARVKGYRPDRHAADADTIESVQAMLSSPPQG
jgi:DNA ligase-1